MLLIRTFFTENALTTRGMLCKGIRIPESEKFLHEESRSLHFGIRNLNSTEKDLESSTLNPESTAWNPESKTVLDSLTWGNFSLSLGALRILEGLGVNLNKSILRGDAVPEGLLLTK